MKLSVVIPAYNCLELLNSTLISLEKQDLDPGDFEVIVIDDCSPDDTYEYLQAYDGPLNLVPIRNEVNQGRAVTRNRGIEQAKGELVLFLDADTEAGSADFLAQHLRAQADGAQVSVGFRIFHPDLKKTGIMRYLENRGAAKHPAGAEIPGRYFVSCNASAPRAVLIDEGGFDHHFVHYGGEDLELGYRLSRRLPIRSLPSAIGWHRHVRKSGELLRITQEFGGQSLPYLFSKHPELKQQLSFDKQPPRTLRDYLIRTACAGPFFEMMKPLGKLAFMPPFVYNYLIFRSYREGYLMSTNDSGKHHIEPQSFGKDK